MADELRIAADIRTEFGKGAARRIRRAGRVPAVMYGHGIDPVHVSLPGHDTMLALKNPNALLAIDLPGGDRLALPKAIQRDPIKGFLEHVDLLLVRRGEKVTVEVQVHVVGEPAPDSLVSHELNALTIEAEATHIPTEIEVSVEGLTVGSHITAGDVRLPAGSTLVTEPDHLVLSILAAPTAEQLAEGEEAEGAEVEAPAEGEEAEGAAPGSESA